MTLDASVVPFVDEPAHAVHDVSRDAVDMRSHKFSATCSADVEWVCRHRAPSQRV